MQTVSFHSLPDVFYCLSLFCYHHESKLCIHQETLSILYFIISCTVSDWLVPLSTTDWSLISLSNFCLVENSLNG